MGTGHGARSVAAALLVVLLGGRGAVHAEEPTVPTPRQAPPPNSVPFPVDRTTTVRSEGRHYYVDGPQVIPPTAEITVQLGVQVWGINGASLDVQGGLKVHGTEETWVVIRDVDLSPTRAPKRGLHLDMADFHGCRWAHAEGEGIEGDVTVENSCFQGDCTLDIRLRGGFFKVMTTEIATPATVRLERPATSRVPLELEVRTSWLRSVTIVGPGDVHVRHCEVQGRLELQGVTNAEVDGCDLRGDLCVLQGASDTFKKVRLTKCNLFAGTLVLDRPRQEGVKRERVKVDKFCFDAGGTGLQDPKEIAKRVRDHGRDEDGNVQAVLAAPEKRPHVLVSYTLRSRAPPLR